MKRRPALYAWLLLVLVFAGLIAWHRHKLLKPSFAASTGSMNYGDPSHLRDFTASSRAGRAVDGWIASHQSGWKFSSTFPSDARCRNDSVIGGDAYYIDLDLAGATILLVYKGHPDDDVRIERALSPDEQASWRTIIEQILAYNSVLESPPAPGPQPSRQDSASH